MTTRPRILLFGASGQVGRELLRSLAPLGDVTPIVRQASRDPAYRAARSLDLSHEHAVRALVRDLRPRLIINAAAYTAVDRAEQEPEAAALANEALPRWLADEAKHGDAALVHYSTDYVFDGRGSTPWREDDPTGPLCVYGRTKLAGEQAIRAADCAHLIIRTSWVYGIHGNNFVKTMLKLGQTRDRLRIVDDQTGAPTSARQIAEVTSQILGASATDWPSRLAAARGLVHMACGGSTSWLEFAREIFALARAIDYPTKIEMLEPISTADYGAPAARPLNSRLDMSRLAECYNLVAPDWRDALAHEFTDIARMVPSVGNATSN
ncbi:MAG TPA: dTDP-4-dehydrorhamnose reductase [Pirellulales bacterium]|nr:dTDP-4-dehydrorhamnose reductase [Pirellulales bacterium]